MQKRARVVRPGEVAVALGLVALGLALRGRGPSPASGPASAESRSQARGSRPAGTGAPPGAPEEAVAALFDAASRGDDEAYLALVAGDLRRSLLRTRDEIGRESFRESLRRSASGIKGVACVVNRDGREGSRRRDADAEGETDFGELGRAEPAVSIDVDIVFADRNERQRVLVAPRGGRWVVVSLGRAETAKPPVPYGTPVFEE